MYIFLRQGHHVRPQILKQHVAGIEVSGLLDLKKDHAVFAIWLADGLWILTRPGYTFVQALSGIESRASNHERQV